MLAKRFHYVDVFDHFLHFGLRKSVSLLFEEFSIDRFVSHLTSHSPIQIELRNQDATIIEAC